MMPAMNIGSEVQEELESQLCLQLPVESASETSTIASLWLESISDIQHYHIQHPVERLNLGFLSDDDELEELSNDEFFDDDDEHVDGHSASTTDEDSEDEVIFAQDVLQQISQTVRQFLWGDENDLDAKNDDDTSGRNLNSENGDENQNQKPEDDVDKDCTPLTIESILLNCENVKVT